MSHEPESVEVHVKEYVDQTICVALVDNGMEFLTSNVGERENDDTLEHRLPTLMENDRQFEADMGSRGNECREPSPDDIVDFSLFPRTRSLSQEMTSARADEAAKESTEHSEAACAHASGNAEA